MNDSDLERLVSATERIAHNLELMNYTLRSALFDEEGESLIQELNRSMELISLSIQNLQ